MNAIVDQALPLWGLSGAAYRLIAARENAVYCVEGPHGPVALRLRRAGYRGDAELASELDWMAAVSQGGIAVPAPIASVEGAMLHVVEGVQVDVLAWLSGETLADAMERGDRVALSHALGREMARLHDVSDAWTPPDGFVRVAWDAEGLIGDAPVWDRFWENPLVEAGDRDLFVAFRQKAARELAGYEGDYGLIHADLIPDNVIVQGKTLSMIDFDDGGFGYRLFDIATALLKHIDAADFEALRAAMLEGYRSARGIETDALDLFMALRAATYVGWNITRLEEAGGAARNSRFVARLRGFAAAYLG